MTSTQEPPAPPHPGIPPARTHPTTDANRSIRPAGTTAGVALLALTVLAVFGNFIVLEGLVTRGDAARTATDVLASEGMFRLAYRQFSWSP